MADSLCFTGSSVEQERVSASEAEHSNSSLSRPSALESMFRQNIQAKKILAMELRSIGLSMEAIGRILHLQRKIDN
jgi:predicted ATPase with chaperone activity